MSKRRGSSDQGPAEKSTKMSKSPAQILNEICAKAGVKPVITYANINPIPNAPPIFEATCTVEGFLGKSYVAAAHSGNKKNACQKVSEIMVRDHMKLSLTDPSIDPMEELNNPGSSSASTSDAVDDEMDISKIILDEPIEENAVGNLKAYIEDKGLLDAVYEDLAMKGQSHNPVFIVKCTIEGVETTGTHKTKKMCKRIAAGKMISALEELRLKNPDRYSLMIGKRPKNEEMSQEEIDQINRVLEIAKSDPSQAGLVRTRRPFDWHRSQAIREDHWILKNQFKNLKYKGPLLEELLKMGQFFTISSGTNRKPVKEFKVYFANHEGGVKDFYNGLKKELKFKDTFSCSPKLDENETNADARIYHSTPAVMVALTVQLPKILRKPTGVGLADTSEEAEEIAMLEVLVYLSMAC